ncbi:MAG TPA: A24 family peptidase [Burkholderiales bacterium]|nr:A24 family peptidase [Burkholderiales bacterium]
MPYIDFLRHSHTLFPVLALIFGLIVGSFLNVVIHRLPIMLERQWRNDCLSLEGQQPEILPSYNLLTPGSNCPNCSRRIRPLENIPVISFIIMGGRCAGCKKNIRLRYPVIELVTGILSFFIAWYFGFEMKAASGLLFAYSLITLSAIDFDQQILPDSITLPLLWIGLLLNLDSTFAAIGSAVIGAVAGYMALWLVYWGFKLITGKEGMGRGDFKLLAALGAWFGWTSLPAIILLASIGGAVVGLSLIQFKNQNRDIPIPFGPYLAGGGIMFLFFGPYLTHFYLP